MATPLVSSLVAEVRTDSDLNTSQVVTDQQIAGMISDAGSALRDVFTSANQKYDISTFDFTLPGGIGGNSIPLPSDFQQGHSVDINPNTLNPTTLRYLSNWLDRNKSNGNAIWSPSSGPQQYYFLGTNLIVLPAASAGGVPMRLYYTPTWTPLALPSPPVDVETASIGVHPASTMGFGVSNNFLLDTGPATFLPTDVGNSLVVLGDTNPANNGTFTISAFISSTNVTVAQTVTSSTFSGATVTLFRKSRVSGPRTFALSTSDVPEISSGNYSFSLANANFSANDVGSTLVITFNAPNTAWSGSYVITQVLSTTFAVVSGTFPASGFVSPAGGTASVTSGVWTLYGANPFNNPTLVANVGDTLIVSGATNTGNNGPHVVTVGTNGGNQVTTDGTGLVAENFGTQLTVTIQPAGTTATLPAIMSPWILYLKTIACITIRNKRGQDVEAFQQRLAVMQQRIETILQERQEEPTSPPWTKQGGGGFFGGGW